MRLIEIQIVHALKRGAHPFDRHVSGIYDYAGVFMPVQLRQKVLHFAVEKFPLAVMFATSSKGHLIAHFIGEHRLSR